MIYRISKNKAQYGVHAHDEVALRLPLTSLFVAIIILIMTLYVYPTVKRGLVIVFLMLDENKALFFAAFFKSNGLFH